MQIHNLSESNSVLNHFLSQIREVTIQKDSMRFRRNMERIGEIMAYEISKKLTYSENTITTPLGIKNTTKITEEVVLCSILRAGLTLHQGFLNYFDAAENGFISAYRNHYNSDENFDILVEYQSVPNMNDKTLILVVIAAPEGIKYVSEKLPKNCNLWVASLDEKLNEKNYIVPGLGDAGDLAYGTKL